MSTAVQMFMGGAVRPANVAEAFADDGNIAEKVSIPSISVAGKKFAMKVNGEETVLTKTDPDTGERVNLPFMNVVVVNMNPNRSRTFFAKPYVSGENQIPTCYSSDGKTPDRDVKAPVAASCATCPNAVKGSRIKDGREGYACESKKRLAVWPEAMLRKPELGIPVLQMILPITSIWDKENKANDAEMWFAWDNYVVDLRQRGVKHTGEVITRVKFDNTEYPKLLFKAVRWLDDADHARFNELAAVKSVKDTEDVRKLLHGRMYEGDDTPEVPAIDTPHVAIPVKAVEEDDGFGEAAPAAAPAVEAKPTPKAPKVVKPKAAEPSKPAPTVEAPAATSNLAALAAEWDA